ncbi:hypothetical protein A9Q84_15315 [Halobacteriovorax marinus]|uniref:Uncharacterized protein n=1 Tax=Halobacteriovorax marinus TaxID=97084 RepID=A0A1Y5FBT0_9BACT|nr:hypothetical protein A9Q84_15315 [Halobacteriovorax marinus]
MIDAKCIEDNTVAYVKARDIETHDIKIDGEGYITFYNTSNHKYYKSELPWDHGLDEFITFVDCEVNSAEIDDAA